MIKVKVATKEYIMSAYERRYELMQMFACFSKIGPKTDGSQVGGEKTYEN
jgi:hypothetical protein